MNRTLWIGSITEQSAPAWPCPTCGQGTLALVPKSLKSEQTYASRHGYHDTEFVFSVWLKCSYGNCGESAVVVGTGSLQEMENEEIVDGHPMRDCEAVYQPLLCHPMPDMIRLPEKCPDEVKSELRAAFRFFWADQTACADHIRGSLSALMDHYHVSARSQKHDASNASFALQERIKNFAKTNKTVGKKLIALNCLDTSVLRQSDMIPDHLSVPDCGGRRGGGNLRQDNLFPHDLLTDLETLEHVLAALFDPGHITADVKEAVTPKYVLRKGHKAWSLVFDGSRETPLPESKAVYYVDWLLKHPRREFKAATLWAKAPAVRRDKVGKSDLRDNDTGEDVSLSKEGGSEEYNLDRDDKPARQTSWKIEKDLKQTINDPNSSGEERELAEIRLEELKKVQNKLRRTKNEEDKQFFAVSRAINRLLRSLAVGNDKHGQPDVASRGFAGHLKLYLLKPSKLAHEYGSFVYQPQPGVEWAD